MVYFPMIEAVPAIPDHIPISPDKLLIDDEAVIIVDDDHAIRDPLKVYLEMQGLKVADLGSATELFSFIENHSIALILLDIGLPDMDGLAILPRIVSKHPDISVIMLTGLADLHVAMECLRKGADDYLSKPVQFHEILFVVKKALEKRRLILENRRYQNRLVQASFRFQLLHQLSIKMNSVYLTTVELDDILRAVLVGITADEGLGFNRAFLALFDDDDLALRGRMAIGPSCREEAGKIWTEMQARHFQFLDIIHNLASCNHKDHAVNQIARLLWVPTTDTEHILVRSARERRSFNIQKGRAEVPVSRELINILGEDSFVVVPLFSPRKSYGVIIADNLITQRPIGPTDLNDLEIFASQSSLAIEQSHHYADMQNKIQELEILNRELDRNKDLLVEAERYSALGHMAAQMVHAIKNPLTSLGGTARQLGKRVKDAELQKYISIIVKESERLERILDDLFAFVDKKVPELEKTELYSLIKTTAMLVQSDLSRSGITLTMDLPEPEPVLNIDARQMKQMLLHLIKNAIDAMPGGGVLYIAVETDSDFVHINVLDTGMGISDSHLSKMTDPFFTTKTYGTGMGLTMVERIVQTHNGTLVLKKRTPSGLNVQINLPLARVTTQVV